MPNQIYTDSETTMGYARAEHKVTVHNELVKRLQGIAELLDKREGFEAFHVKGHIGHPWNELGDHMCTAVALDHVYDSGTPMIGKPRRENGGRGSVA